MVPVFEALTNLPPFIGILFGLPPSPRTGQRPQRKELPATGVIAPPRGAPPVRLDHHAHASRAVSALFHARPGCSCRQSRQCPTASAATCTTTVTETAPTTLRAGNPQYVVASVTADGAPVADGTLVHFELHGNRGSSPSATTTSSPGPASATAPPTAPTVLAGRRQRGREGLRFGPRRGRPGPQLRDLQLDRRHRPDRQRERVLAGDDRRQGLPFGDAPQGVTDYGPLDND